MTDKEIMQALLDGKTLRKIGTDDKICLLGNGVIGKPCGAWVLSVYDIFNCPHNWEIYEPPIEFKKKTMFQVLTRDNDEYVLNKTGVLFASIQDARAWADKIFYGVIPIEVYYE